MLRLLKNCFFYIDNLFSNFSNSKTFEIKKLKRLKYMNNTCFVALKDNRFKVDCSDGESQILGFKGEP